MSSKYKKIIIDENSQCPNPGMKINVTAEMWYDIMHHTHESNGSSDASEDVGQKITVLAATINELIELIKTQSQQIQSMQDSIDKLNKYVEEDLFISDTASQNI